MTNFYSGMARSCRQHDIIIVKLDTEKKELKANILGDDKNIKTVKLKAEANNNSWVPAVRIY